MFLCLAVAFIPFAQTCQKEIRVPVTSLPRTEKPPTETVDCHICCSDELYSEKLDNLDNIETEIIGQHIAVNLLKGSVKAHLLNKNPGKPLVLSLHGSSGIGKSYFTKVLAESLLRSGLKSPNVLLLHGSSIKPDKDSLRTKIQNQFAKCARSFVIIDDVDSVENGILDSLQPLLEYHDSVDGVDYRKGTFILISNRGSKQINDIVINSNDRASLDVPDFEKSVTNAAFNSPGGLLKSALIEKGLIDLYVPFLPLDMDHVVECVRRYLTKNEREINEKLVQKIVDSFQYFASIYLSSGCKKVAARTDMYSQQYKSEKDEENDEL